MQAKNPLKVRVGKNRSFVLKIVTNGHRCARHEHQLLWRLAFAGKSYTRADHCGLPSRPGGTVSFARIAFFLFR